MRAPLLAVPAVALALSACSIDQEGTATAIVQVEPSPWESDGIHAGAGPAFPTALEGWQLAESWNHQVRVFNDQWSTAAGKNWADFPATMNGCDGAKFLVRWRALQEDSIVVSAWVGGDLSGSNAAPAAAGWMVLDGCETPRWQLLSPYGPTGNFLSGITVDYQEWTPAP